MLCKRCGKEIQEGWKVCPSCGTEILPETEDAQAECREYKLKGVRRTGRFSFQEIITDIRVEGGSVHVAQGAKKPEIQFYKREVQSIDFPLLPIWRISDILRLAVFGMLAFISYGLSIFAILFSIKIMVSRHVRIKLNSGQAVKIPICQKGDASDFLKELSYPLPEIEKNNASKIEDKKWVRREWLASAALMAVAAGTLALGIALKSENMKNARMEDAMDESAEAFNGTEGAMGEGAETFNETEDAMGEDAETFNETEDMALGEQEDLPEETESMTVEEYLSHCEKTTGEDLARNPEKYIGKDILLEGKFNILSDSIVIDWFADSGIIRVDYDGKAIDVQGNVVGNVMSGDYGYVAGRYGGEDEWGTRYIDAEIIILDNGTEENAEAAGKAEDGTNAETAGKAEDEANAAEQTESFAIPAGVYRNDQLFEGRQALLTLTYFEDEQIGVEFSTEPQSNSIALYGFRIDNRTIEVAEEYTGIIVTLTWESETEVTVSCSEEFTGMDSDMFHEMVNAHYSLALED